MTPWLPIQGSITSNVTAACLERRIEKGWYSREIISLSSCIRTLSFFEARIRLLEALFVCIGGLAKQWIAQEGITLFLDPSRSPFTMNLKCPIEAGFAN